MRNNERSNQGSILPSSMFSHYIRYMVWIGKVLYMATIKSIIMKETLEQLKQDAIQIRHRMKRAQYADDLIAMDDYAVELAIINQKIKKHEDTLNQHSDKSGEG